ncbi:AAA family ATPase [Kribbella sp. NBC_01505]|uniref:ATP-binding protein n=1 Tax=Kribbella sp. NBC_01505 TaxID=2903580 RepID=UPI003865EAA5
MVDGRVDGLVERAAALDTLAEAVAAVRDGGGAGVVLSGEAGIGKSSLVRSFLSRLGEDTTAFVGLCDDLSTAKPLGPFRDAFRGTGIAEVLTSAGPHEVFTAVVDELSRAEKSVLVLEDVHWADDGSIDLLHYLVRRLDRLPLLIVMTFRTEALETRSTLRRVLASVSSPRWQRLELGPLSETGIADLAGPQWSAHELLALTGGNPFYLTEVLAGPRHGVPASVQDAIFARVNELGEQAVATLEQLSVIPTAIPISLAETLAAGDGDAVVAAEAAGILEVHGAEPATITFRHELARRAVASGVPPIRRRQLNRNVLEAMVAEGDTVDLGSLAHHAVESGDIESIVRFVPAAGHEAARTGANREALKHFETAIRYEAETPDAELTDLLAAYSWQLHLAGRHDEAIPQGIAAVERRAVADDRGALTDALLGLSRTYYVAGDIDAASAMADRAVSAAAGTGAEAAAATSQGVMTALRVESAQAISQLEAALELSRQAGRPDLVALCLNYLGMAHCDLGDEQGLDLMRTSLETARRGNDREVVARSYFNLSHMLLRFHRWNEMETIAKAGLAFSEEWNLLTAAQNLAMHMGVLATHRGDWAEAERRFVALAPEVPDTSRRATHLATFYGQLLARQGHPDAEELLNRAWAAASGEAAEPTAVLAGLALLDWCWLHGRADPGEVIRTTLLGSERSVARSGPLREQLDRALQRTSQGTFEDWRAAAARWEELGAPYEQAVELAGSGEVEPTVEALRIFRALGARPAVDLVKKRLRALGVSPERAGHRPNQAGLTARQLKVMRMIADGMTNAEIADELALSVRTVEHHTAAILRKLDLETRRGVRARARELGLLEGA